MAYIDLASLAPALKELYGPQEVKNLVYQDRPMLALLEKNKRAYVSAKGKAIPIPVIIGVGQGASSTFSNAQTNQSGGRIQEFMLTRKTGYSIATISQEALLASDGDIGSFIDGHKFQFDGAFTTAANRAAQHLYRDGSGTIGTISTIGSVATGVIQLTNNDDAVNFEQDQTLQSNNAGTLRAAVAYVISVNTQNGQIVVANTMGGAAANPSGWTAGDFLVTSGDFNLVMTGLTAWLPQTVPNPDSFFGVNRNGNRTRLAGVWQDGSANTIEEAAINLSAGIAKEGGKPTHGFMDFTSYAGLERSVGTKVQYVNIKADEDAQINFEGISFTGRNGKIMMLPDRWCVPQQLFMLTLSSWTLYSIEDVPHLTMYGDGLPMLRVGNADANEMRVSYYGNLASDAPGWNGTCLLGT